MAAPEALERTPVAFMIFNRPAFTARVFEAIARARPPRLLVVADGPRADHPDDARLCSEARAVVERVDWPCELSRCYADENLGCKLRIASGLDWVFEQVPEAIIVEDDCLPEPSFFRFCEQLLERYREDERVQMISGCNVLPSELAGEYSYYFSRCYHIWGWATWRRAWSQYDLSMSRWPALRATDWVERLVNDRVAARIARGTFDETHAGNVPTWDFQWVFAGWCNGGLSVVPRVNLVTNIGYGDAASHERDADSPLANLPTGELEQPLRHPPEVAVLESADRAEWRLTDPGVRETGDSTVIVSTGTGYPPEQLAPFVTSLRRAGYDGDVVLFVNRALRQALRRDPRFDSVRLVCISMWPPIKLGFFYDMRAMKRFWRPVQEVLRGVAKLIEAAPVPQRWRERLLWPVAWGLFTPMEFRFMRYRRFLQEHDYQRVLLCDLRDVLFQEDPFETLPTVGLAVSIETDGYTVATEPHNAGWVERAYGPELLARIGGNPVANVGVTYGDRRAIADYVDQFTGEMFRLSPSKLGIGGGDMAIHNMLAWSGRLGEIVLLEPLRSSVATLNGIDPARLELDGEGRLLNEDGSRPSVVHQPDRQPSVNERLLQALAA